MKFNRFLNEVSTNDIIENIKKDCKPYLKARDKGHNDELFLTSHRKLDDFVLKFPIRKDRKPLDTPQPFHELFDEIFYDLFKVKARSQSLFCEIENFTMSFPNLYGTPYLVFPIGNFSVIFSKEIYDLGNKLYQKIENDYGTLVRIGDTEAETLKFKSSKEKGNYVGSKKDDLYFHKIFSEKREIYGFEEFEEKMTSSFKKIIKENYFYVKNDIPLNKINIGNAEIMLQCDNVYLINIDKIKNHSAFINSLK